MAYDGNAGYCNESCIMYMYFEVLTILILIVVRARVTRARVRVSRQSRLAGQGPRPCEPAAKPRHVAAKPWCL